MALPSRLARFQSMLDLLVAVALRELEQDQQTVEADATSSAAVPEAARTETAADGSQCATGSDSR